MTASVVWFFVSSIVMVLVDAMVGSFGCIRRVRAASREIAQAIAEASGGYDIQDARYLRAEMKAHYKLAETGVISREACSDSMVGSFTACRSRICSMCSTVTQRRRRARNVLH